MVSEKELEEKIEIGVILPESVSVMYGEQLDYRYYAYTTSHYNWTDFQKPPAEFAPGFNDYGLDTNNNTLYDYLVIEKEIEVREAGNYELYGSLEAPSGKWIDSDSNYTYLGEGLHNVTLKFYGPSIYLSGESGNFDVYMDLYDRDNGRWLDWETNTTSYYSYTDFERLPAEFTGNFSDYGLDTDNDTLYNYLLVEAEINVTKAGEYELRGNLRPAGKSFKVSATTPPAGGGGGGGVPPAWIDWDSNRTYLEAGIHNISLQFDGIRIYNTGYNGSFRTWLRLYETEEGHRIDEMEYLTKVYNYTDFQKPLISVIRDLPDDPVYPEDEISVTLNQSGFFMDIGTVTEQLPEGFTCRGLASGSGGDYTYPSYNPTNTLTIEFRMETTVTYIVETGTAEQIENAVFSGTWRTVDSQLNKINGSVEGDATLTLAEPTPVFDTGSGTYPSIFGTHNGTITPNQTITVQKLYTYPCAGTGGHTEYARIWDNSGLNAIANWSGYKGDWHTITFNETFVLYKNKTYNYTLRTGSYPQIIHAKSKDAIAGAGTINCTNFIDANGKEYTNWIPAIKLFL